MDPFADAKRLENGALFYVLEDKELDPILGDEEKLRDEFTRLSEGNAVYDEEDEAEIRIKVLERLETDTPFSLDYFNEIFDRELSVFKEGENYDYVKDLKHAYRE